MAKMPPTVIQPGSSTTGTNRPTHHSSGPAKRLRPESEDWVPGTGEEDAGAPALVSVMRLSMDYTFSATRSPSRPDGRTKRIAINNATEIGRASCRERVWQYV